VIVDIIVSWVADVIDITSLLGFESRIFIPSLTQVVYTSGVELRYYVGMGMNTSETSALSLIYFYVYVSLFLLLCLCILIVMYFLFYIFCFIVFVLCIVCV